MKVSCMIIDDEPLAVNLVENYISQLPYLELHKKCYHAIEALEYLKDHKVDLIFLDINMPHVSGMQLSGLFPSGQKFIFITAHAEFAAESYEKNAIDYLLKPITPDRFLKAVDKVMHLVQLSSGTIARPDNDDTIFLKSGKTIVKLQYRDVMVIEGLKDYVLFHTQHGKHIMHKRMKALEEELPEIFSRVHNSYFINRTKIQKIADNHIYLEGFAIPLSDKYRDNFIQLISGRLI